MGRRRDGFEFPEEGEAVAEGLGVELDEDVGGVDGDQASGAEGELVEAPVARGDACGVGAVVEERVERGAEHLRAGAQLTE